MTTAPQIIAPLTKERLLNQTWAAWLKTGETSPRAAFLAGFNAVCEVIGLPPQEPPRDIQPEEWAPRGATWQHEREEREGYVQHLLGKIEALNPERLKDLTEKNEALQAEVQRLQIVIKTADYQTQ